MSEWIRAAVVAAALLSVVPATAQASPVLRVKEGHARWMEDRFMPAASALPPAPAGKRVRLAPGAPPDELSSVIATAETLDVTPSRLNVVELTLKRNAEFWAFAAPPAPGRG